MGSYGNNITISMPGDDWQMLWPDDFSNFQLDIVGFLAILGEQSILANAQVAALSRLFYLPRLLPAPQALLRVSRPDKLRPVPATVCSVQSGNKIGHIHHVASILLETAPGDLRPYSVRCVRITKSREHGISKPPTLFDRVFRGVSKQKQGVAQTKENSVKARAAGPLTWVTMLSFLLTLTIILTSFLLGDGMSLMAAVLLSLLSTVVGIANKWELQLPTLPKNTSKHADDDSVVIKYPNGAFMVVKSNEHIRRELFFAPEEINYTVKSAMLYRILALVGSVMLMFGVILLANARLELQLAWAASYIILNAAYWAAAAVPAKLHWDLSYYHVEEEGVHFPVELHDADEDPGITGPHGNNFTTALWKVILLTKETVWVRNGEGAPNTPVWDDWLVAAGHAARRAEPASRGLLESPVRAWHSDGVGLIHRSPPGFKPKKVFNDLADREKEQKLKRSHTADDAAQLGRQAVAGAPPYSATESSDIV